MQHNDFEKTNLVWTWDENGDFIQYHLDKMISGDTDSAYLKISDSIVDAVDGDIDEIVNVGDTIGEMTNEAFPDFCMRAFNCPEERKDTIKTDRETIFDKGFFLTKKRYILHVVDDEGDRVDKLKIMGVEIKKSNTSTATKDILMALVNRILDGYSEKEVKQFIKDCKKDFSNYDLKDIAMPNGCKTLHKTEGIYKMTDEIKGHWVARAALIYNIMCEEYDKRVLPGEKVGVLYIRHPKYKYIGYPLDTENLPDWLYEIPIDYDTMWKKTHKTITNYLESLEWDTKSKKKKIKQELFGM